MNINLWRDHKVSLLTALLCILLAALYWFGFDRIPSELDRGYGAAARKNPFLAIEQFSQQEGKNTRQLHSLALFDGMAWQGQPVAAQDTIMLSNGYKALNHERFARVKRWVENGGTLIFHSNNPFIDPKYGANDPLFAHLHMQTNTAVTDSIPDDDKNPTSAIPPDTEDPEAITQPPVDTPENSTQALDNDWLKALAALAQDAPDDQQVYCHDKVARLEIAIPRRRPSQSRQMPAEVLAAPAPRSHQNGG